MQNHPYENHGRLTTTTPAGMPYVHSWCLATKTKINPLWFEPM